MSKPLVPKRAPRAFHPDRAEETARAFADLPADQRDLLAGTSACSPYLAGLIRQEGDWIRGALQDPDQAVALVMATPLAPERVAQDLRQAKARIALLTALADLGGVWPLMKVTGVLTQFADWAVQQALIAALGPLAARGALPGLDPQDPAYNPDLAGGLCVFAMGKMGAGELNYSSDIDLICLFDETRAAPDAYPTLRNGFAKAVRAMCATLSDITANGYVFRTDLRLRPDPGVTPVALSFGAAERYYESLGRTWERAAWIKARPAAGDRAAGAHFQDLLRPFVWRKHLDYAAIEDAHNMRLAIREAKGLSGAVTLPGHDVKLGRGGIREIEFFTQTRQLIAGGRDPDLRVRGTLEGLQRLADKGWVAAPAAQTLAAHYTYLRNIEHRLQMVQDAQTHALPRSDEGFAQLAAMMDLDRAQLEGDLHACLNDVHAMSEAFFRPDAADAPKAKPAPPDPEAPDPDAASMTLPPEVEARWRKYPALRSDRGRALFARIRPDLLRRLARARRPGDALAAFDRFLAGLPAGVQLFALFEANPSLVDLLLDILTVAPPLADHLARNPGVLDAVIGGDFFAPWPGRAALQQDLADALARETDYERQLDTARRWLKEWHFRVGVHALRDLADTDETGAHYADLASASLRALWPVVVAEFSGRHGPLPGRGAAVIGMGSLGAGRLSPSSDLDLIVVYDAGGAQTSDGPKPLPVTRYYARLTQALVTALSARTAEGRMYQVDMRLRPSGNQGPVATSLSAFQHYQRHQAWTWEHLALTRARPLAGTDALIADLEATIATVLQTPRVRADLLQDVADMRVRIAKARAPASLWDTKTGPGRLQDIELLVQTGALLCGAPARDIPEAAMLLPQAGLLSEPQAQMIRACYLRLAGLQMVMRLVGLGGQDPDQFGAGGADLVLRRLGETSLDAAEAALGAQYKSAQDVIDQVFSAPVQTQEP